MPVRIFFAVYFLLLVLAFVLFLPVLNKGFASDDYLVLYRIIHSRSFYTPDFFRPLSDISLYLSYQAAGLSPFFYNAVNITVHASSAFLLYRLCWAASFLTIANRSFFAWTAALLFLVYPFHNEAILWAIGRGIVLSGFFGFLSLLVVFLDISPVKKFTLSYVFYFIGLCGYETIIPLPLIVLVLLYTKQRSVKSLIPAGVGYLLVFLLNLLLRLLLSGAVLSSYGSTVFRPSAVEYAVKFFKTAGRLLLPPSGFSLALGIAFAIVLAGIAVISIVIIKRKNSGSATYIKLAAALLAAVVIPAMFGISTKTFEGDRVLYFPSFFLCLWVAYLVSLLHNSNYRLAAGGALIFYFLFFFYRNIFSWKESSKNVAAILSAVAGMRQGNGTVYLLNMPEEFNGVPVFRRGFTEALLISNIDTAGIRVVNYLATDHSAGLRENIQPVQKQGRLFIPPYTYIKDLEILAGRKYNDSTLQTIHCKGSDKLYYWNRNFFVRVPLPQGSK